MNFLDSEDGGSNLVNFVFIVLCHISEELNFHQHFFANLKVCVFLGSRVQTLFTSRL